MDPKRRLLGALERLNNIEFYTPATKRKELYEKSIRDAVEAIRELYAQGEKEHIKEAAREAVSRLKDGLWLLTYELWERRKELLDRSIGHFFHHVFKHIKQNPGLVRHYENLLPHIALLGLAAHHDIPSIKRLDKGAIGMLVALRGRAETGDYLRMLGRRSLRRFVELYDTIKKYVQSMGFDVDSLELDVIDSIFEAVKLDKEAIRELERKMGKSLSWPDYVVHRLDELLKTTPVDLDEYNVHPEDRKLLKPFLYIYHDKIDNRLKKVKGEEFFRYKFGRKYNLVLQIIKKLEEINAKKRKYRYEIPDNYVAHLAAQVVNSACTSWDSYIMGVLHGPFIPIVLKDKEGRIEGRLFVGLAKHVKNKKYYLVLGDYVGSENGRRHFNRDDIYLLLVRTALEQLGTSAVRYNHAKTTRHLVTTHANPWIYRVVPHKS